jgi:hypothetical protein
MIFKCSELQGANFQPRDLLKIDNCWIIPAFNGAPMSTMLDHKLIFVYQKETPDYDRYFEEYLFVCCYQFLFFVYSHIYKCFSLSRHYPLNSFILNGSDISDIEKQIQNKYGQQDAVYWKEFSIDFTNIDGPFHTNLPISVNFQDFYRKFMELFKKDNEFKEIVTLFCETVNGVKPLYNNVLQQITQLQTIFETLIGSPKSSKCSRCGMNYYVEDWDQFIESHLKEYKIISTDDINLIKIIKTTLNKVARREYVHNAKYYNPYELKNIWVDFQTEGNSIYTTDISQVLGQKSNSWKGIDWINIYMFYQLCVRNVIYSKYFLS